MSRKGIFRPFFCLMLASGEFLRCDDDVIFTFSSCRRVSTTSWVIIVDQSDDSVDPRSRFRVCASAKKLINVEEIVTNWNFHFSPLSFHAHGCHIWCNCCLSRSWTSSETKLIGTSCYRKSLHRNIVWSLGRNSKSILQWRSFLFLFHIGKGKIKKVEEEKS